MYKLLLCFRYLQTRYLAFVCIVSVMLGVATLIVVNAVMSGFSTKLKDRLRGVISDVIIETDGMMGFIKQDKDGRPILDPRDGRPIALPPEDMMAAIWNSPAGPLIEAIAPTNEVFAILQFRFRGHVITKPVKLIGVDPVKRAEVGGFSEYLVRQKNHPAPSFDPTPEALQRHNWNRTLMERTNPTVVPGFRPIEAPITPRIDPNDPLAMPFIPVAPVTALAPKTEMDLHLNTPVSKLHGVILGFNLAHYRYPKDGQMVEEAALELGDDVTLMTVGGDDLKPVWGGFLVTDYLKTEMSEYDQSFVYVPLDQLQKIRGMSGRCSAIQLKLKNYDQDKAKVVAQLRELFPGREIRIGTWEDNQGPLLAAIDVERGILNLLLFMIVGVAGFSILAIFTMIVSEKYRDIGVLKSLGASSRGVMGIFLGYGLLLGAVGCGLGTVMGLTFTRYINEIEAFLTKVTGRAVFPRDVYYFKEIPTNVDPLSIVLVNLGAVTIAVVFSLLPAYRAARLHPVRALRFE